MSMQRIGQNATQLRQEAEAQLTHAPQTKLTPHPADELLHELQLHQLELEMQNEKMQQAQVELEESRDRYADLYEFAPVGYLTLSHDGMINEINLTGAALLGVDRNKLPHHRFAPFVATEDRDRWHRHFINVLTRDDTLTCELALQHGDGPCFYARLDCLCLKKGSKESAVRIALIDNTARKQAEDKIRLLNEELMRKEKLAVLGQVTGSVGHELRNPLGVMSNAVYFLQTVLSDADETTKEYLNIIKDEIAGSERIVSDLLESVRTQPPHPEMVGVRELLEKTLGKCAVPSSVTVKLDIPATLSKLLADPQQIHQVLRNLISNGAEAMLEGGTLEIRALENAQAKTVTVSVRDTGSGMTPEQLGHLFQPLFTTKPRGIGLGLVVVKNLTEANGGSVAVESTQGKGSVFSVTLPCSSGEMEM